ncbi:MAG TPA: hypothetical protein VFB50_15970 [Chloroflexota bacterium]|nr:hypothetical protein [Chloroflexota bacterium]
MTNQLERERDELRAEVELRLDQIDGWKERLRASEAENERLQFEVTDWQERNERLSVEAGRLSVEVGGLRAAARELVGLLDGYAWGANQHQQRTAQAVEQLRAALGRD